MASYKEMQDKAIELGYTTPALAMAGIGRTVFMGYFDNPLAKQISSTYSNIVKKENTPKFKAQSPKPKREGKQIAWDSAYTIYENGDVYSDYLGRLLTKIEEKSRKRVFLTMSIRRKKYQVNRLVMFHFGNHSYKNISKMPIVSPIDKDSFNNHIDNLEFVTQADINVKYDLKPTEKCVPKSKIPDTEIEFVKA